MTIITLAPPAWRCITRLRAIGYPTSDTPLDNGDVLVSEINGSWVTEYTQSVEILVLGRFIIPSVELPLRPPAARVGPLLDRPTTTHPWKAAVHVHPHCARTDHLVLRRIGGRWDAQKAVARRAPSQRADHGSTMIIETGSLSSTRGTNPPSCGNTV